MLGVVMLSVVMPSVVMLRGYCVCVNVLRAIMLIAVEIECHYGECRYAVCHSGPEYLWLHSNLFS
jgi:hypothetical protein